MPLIIRIRVCKGVYGGSAIVQSNPPLKGNIFLTLYFVKSNICILARQQCTQSNELTRGPPELVQSFRFIGGVHIGTRVLHVLNLVWFAVSLAYPSGEEGGNFLVQVISTCLCYT
jgi:hypothetical protein